MIATQAVTSAREFLARARKRKVSELPPSVLMRELAECRRQLGIVLALVDDFEDEERFHDVTGLTPGGGARLSPADVLILGQVLADALSWRAPDTCRDCARGAQCDDHADDVRQRDAYRRLARQLGIGVER